METCAVFTINPQQEPAEPPRASLPLFRTRQSHGLQLSPLLRGNGVNVFPLLGAFFVAFASRSPETNCPCLQRQMVQQARRSRRIRPTKANSTYFGRGHRSRSKAVGPADNGASREFAVHYTVQRPSREEKIAPYGRRLGAVYLREDSLEIVR